MLFPPKEVIPKIASSTGRSQSEPIGAPPTPPPSSMGSSPPRLSCDAQETAKSSQPVEILLCDTDDCSYETTSLQLLKIHEIAAHTPKTKETIKDTGIKHFFFYFEF